jgi:hypothetical protein
MSDSRTILSENSSNNSGQHNIIINTRVEQNSKLSDQTDKSRKLKRYENTKQDQQQQQRTTNNIPLPIHMAFDNLALNEEDDDDLEVTSSKVTSHQMRLTATDQANYIEDVKWINSDYERPEQSFLKSFTQSLRVTDMGGRAKLFIRNRFLFLFEKYEKKHKRARLALVSSRVFVTLGSLIVPALILVDDEISERPPLSQTIYYATVGITLAVSIVNALAELLQCSKRFYTQAATHYLLQQEGWAFLLLRGKYRFYHSHRHCWQTFLHNIERIHQNTSAASLLLHRPTNNGSGYNNNTTQGGSPKQQQQNPIDGAFNPDIFESFIEENKQNDQDAADPSILWNDLDPRNTSPHIITVRPGRE